MESHGAAPPSSTLQLLRKTKPSGQRTGGASFIWSCRTRRLRPLRERRGFTLQPHRVPAPEKDELRPEMRDDVVVVLVDRVGLHLAAAGREARRGDAERNGHVGVGRGRAVVLQFDPERLLRRARGLNDGAVVRTDPGRAVADLLDDEVELLPGP